MKFLNNYNLRILLVMNTKSIRDIYFQFNKVKQIREDGRGLDLNHEFEKKLKYKYQFCTFKITFL